MLCCEPKGINQPIVADMAEGGNTRWPAQPLQTMRFPTLKELLWLVVLRRSWRAMVQSHVRFEIYIILH